VLLCSGFCTYGQPGQCGNALDATPGGGDPLCIPMSSFAAKGDGGVCLQGCNCDSECASIGMRCKAWDDPEQAEDYGTNGLCYPEEFLDIPAPDAGSDAGTIGMPCSVPAPVSDAGTDAGDGTLRYEHRTLRVRCDSVRHRRNGAMRHAKADLQVLHPPACSKNG
jgi:hypothetical protein